MGHDISAYVKSKNHQGDGDYSEVAYFRIGAFNIQRQRLFYGVLPPRAADANAGVSGYGDEIQFTREEIANAVAACRYYLDDLDSLVENVLSQPNGSEVTVKKFGKIFESLVGKGILTEDRYASWINSLANGHIVENYDAIRDDLEDTLSFHEKILQEYDTLVSGGDPTAYIEIYFG